MPRFEPFRALRYDRPSAATTSPPYDVLSEDDRNRHAAGDPHNVVHVDMPRGDRPYERAAATLAEWRSDGTLRLDDRPSYTLYRMAFRDDAGRTRATIGVVGALEVVDEGSGGVLPHERTTPKDKTDRLDLTRATASNLSCVWGLSLGTGLTEVLRSSGEPVGEIIDEDGVVHSVERVDEPERIEAISEAISNSDVLIADGHHRYAVARTYRDENRGTSLESAATTTLAYIGELIGDQLAIAAIHRLYRGITQAELIEHLRSYFEVSDSGPAPSDVLTVMEATKRLFLLEDPDSGRFLTPIDDAFASLRDLDSLRLETALAASGAEVAYQHGLDESRQRLASGEFTAGILIRPTSIAEIRRTAEEGLLMPPKSTFFTPKLRTGLVMRDLRSG